MPGFGDLFERLDPDNNVRGVQFEHICKLYLTHDPAYRRLLRQIVLSGEPARAWADPGPIPSGN